METPLIKTAWNVYDQFTPRSIRSWARQLHSYDEVPSGFQAYLPQTEPSVPYMVLIPPESFALFARRNAQLVCLYADRLTILEAIRGSVATTTYLFKDIMYVEHGKILLKSWLTLTAKSGSTSLHYNTVNEELFKPITAHIRRKDAVPDPSQQMDARHDQRERDKFAILQIRNFKYMNYGANSLLPGERVLSMAYQPDIRIKSVQFLKRTVFEEFLTCHLAILTDHEVILIQEPKPTKTRQDAIYGGVMTYIPVRQIQMIDIRPSSAPARRQMTITLTTQGCRSAELTADHAEFDAFKRAWERLQESHSTWFRK